MTDPDWCYENPAAAAAAIDDLEAERYELTSELRSHKAAIGGLQAERDDFRRDYLAQWERSLLLGSERDALAAHVERLREGLHQALIYWGGHCPDEEGAAYAECEKRCDDTPATSLAKLKAQWQAEALREAADALCTNAGGDIDYCDMLERADALERQAKENT